jgi:glucose/arabinose dehydrogenase
MLVIRRAAALVLVLLLAGCATSGDTPDPVTPRQTKTPTPTPTPSASSPAPPPPLSLQTLGTYSSPVWVGTAPGDTLHLFLVEKTGRLLMLDGSGRFESVVLDVTKRITKTNEQGLLSMAFDPGFARNHRFYVFLSDKDDMNRVLAFTLVNGVARAPQELLAVARPFANHNGGLLLFDPTGKLLVGIGDGGSAGDPDNRAQNLGDPHGKILRIDPRTGAGAPDNPFPRYPKVWAFGLRNPWRFSFDTNGDLYIGDVGQSRVEELDVVSRAAQSGANYGWSVFEGELVFKKDVLVSGVAAPVVPALTYAHGEGACSITGGLVYRGSKVPFLKGSYVFGDYCLGQLWATDRTKTGVTPLRELGVKVEGLQSFGTDLEGEVLVLDAEKMYRVVTP